MVILGLGSNLGDRLANLRHALNLLMQLNHFQIQQVSPIYHSDALLPDGAPTQWELAYLNLSLRGDTSLSPHELLAQIKQIEIKVGRKPEERWGPRIIDIDILAWDDLILYDKKLHIPHEHLHLRPFALWPLADVAPRWIYPLPGKLQGQTAATIAATWGSHFDGKAPLQTRQIPHRVDTPQLVGILNITPDSFSDGGQFVHVDNAINHALQLGNAGAEIIDIGAEATNPYVAAISAEQEWQRIEPILLALPENLTNFLIKPKISIDTRHVSVAEQALRLGVDWINDTSGLEIPAMQALLSQYTCDVVMMHHLSIPSCTTNTLPPDCDPVAVILNWAKKQITHLQTQGIGRERIIFDPGIGFGKSLTQSLEIIQRISEFSELDIRILVGHSRKRFFDLVTDTPSAERDLETIVTSLFLARNNIDYLRVHNVAAHMCAFNIAARL
jgi:2-amino-4-hydroxy-6-hydroxymethyldihydropteridine diphosphokinase/dihydropteroate synthase